MFDEEEWALEEPEEIPPRPAWLRRTIVAVASVVAVSMVAVPLWNIIDRGEPPVADNGLEICGFDYCLVQDEMRARGLGAEMTGLANRFLEDAEAVALADRLIADLGEDPVRVEIVDRLDGRVAGQYSPTTRTIRLERPIRSWIVLHEVAHVLAPGHGEDFVDALAALVRMHTAG